MINLLYCLVDILWSSTVFEQISCNTRYYLLLDLKRMLVEVNAEIFLPGPLKEERYVRSHCDLSRAGYIFLIPEYPFNLRAKTFILYMYILYLCKYYSDNS